MTTTPTSPNLSPPPPLPQHKEVPDTLRDLPSIISQYELSQIINMVAKDSLVTKEVKFHFTF